MNLKKFWPEKISLQNPVRIKNNQTNKFPNKLLISYHSVCVRDTLINKSEPVLNRHETNINHDQN